MIREDQLVAHLERAGGTMAAPDLEHAMGLSENTVRSAVKVININRERNGFHIERKRGVGYLLMVDDMARFEAYRKTTGTGLDVTDADARCDAILYYLLQERGYARIDELAERTGLSRTTLLKDLERVEGLLVARGLTLERRRHYGIRVQGDEQAVRRAFTHYVVEVQAELDPIKDYQAFKERIDNQNLKNRLYSILASNHISVSDVAFDNIFEHYAVMLYRISQQHAALVTEDDAEAREAFLDAAQEIAEYTWQLMGIELPPAEVRFLALGIQSKSTITTLTAAERGSVRTAVEEILEELDREYRTSYGSDAALIDSLVLHVVPLLTRISHDLQLKNPVLDQIQTTCANAFTITLRFVELLQCHYDLAAPTADEIGFLALHFAASTERERSQRLDRIKRIVAICATGAGTASLIKIKLKSIFPQAEVQTISERALEGYDGRLPDLFLSTIPCGTEFRGVPIIHVKNFLDPEELLRIEDVTALAAERHPIEGGDPLEVAPLFRPGYFRVAAGGEYLGLIAEQARAMVRDGVARPDFPELVERRERLYPTIFNSGIATPHPVRLEALENTVGVTILENPVVHAGHEVRIIFLINLKPDCLYLHTQIQKVILKIIDQDDLRRRILSCRRFESFIWEIRSIR